MDVKDKVEKEKQTSPSSRPRSISPAKPDHDLKFLSAAKDGPDPRARDKSLSKSQDSSRETFDRQDSKPSLISTSSSSPKVSRKYFTNWKQACDKTKDKTKDFLKRWRTLPESEVLECRAGDMDASSGEHEEKGHGWSVHVWTTWVNRFSEDLECLDIEDEGPEVSLTPVQTEKMTLFFSELLDHDKDEVITDQDFDQLCEKMAHFADWSTNSSEYHILLEVKREYIEHFINPLPTKWQEKPYYKRVCVPEGAPGRTGIPDWLARWAIQIGYCKKFQDLPLYLQYFCKILFAVIDRSSSGVISKEALASFYRSVIGLNSSRVDEIIDTAFNRMTSNEYLILDYGTFTHCYANWLLGKNPNGPGQWVLVPPKDSLPQPPFPVDYSALNTEPAKLEPYAPDKKTNRHSVIV